MNISIRTLEEVAINALPAVQTQLLDGWVLRFANGHTRRANSINPLYPGSWNLQGKIRACEQAYRAQGQKVIFKLTTACEPANLDAILNSMDYQVDAPTSLQVLDLAQAEHFPDPEAGMALPAEIVSFPGLTPDWLAAFYRMNRTAPENQPKVERLLRLILPETRYIGIQHAGQLVALGMGVLQEGFLGLFDVVTDVQYRRQGCGVQVMRSLLDWGRSCNAHSAYLQVMLDNPPALRMYEKLGFQERYQYWYRVKL